jgi:hypothetical protein
MYGRDKFSLFGRFAVTAAVVRGDFDRAYAGSAEESVQGRKVAFETAATVGTLVLSFVHRWLC